jgi:hypothetical protein
LFLAYSLTSDFNLTIVLVLALQQKPREQLLCAISLPDLPSTFPAQADAPSPVMARSRCLFVVGFSDFHQMFKPMRFFLK